MKIDAPSQFPLAPITEPPQKSSTQKDGFGQLLTQAVKETRQLQKDADKRVTAHVSQGEGDLHEVLLAMEKAGIALKLLVQGRNKLIAAYEELNRIQV